MVEGSGLLTRQRKLIAGSNPVTGTVDKRTKPSLRVRIWADSKMVWQGWYYTYEGIDVDQTLHADIVEDNALMFNRSWLIEVADFELDEDDRYLRFGSDTGGMVDPIPLPFGEG